MLVKGNHGEGTAPPGPFNITRHKFFQYQTTIYYRYGKLFFNVLYRIAIVSVLLWSPTTWCIGLAYIMPNKTPSLLYYNVTPVSSLITCDQMSWYFLYTDVGYNNCRLSHKSEPKIDITNKFPCQNPCDFLTWLLIWWQHKRQPIKG